MAPIRVALVGLSASAKVTWAADAHLPYLQSSYGKQHYQLVALLNSSLAAAEAAKRAFNLADVKAYGDPIALAADDDIDLVVVNTRADVHYSVVEPSVRVGKAVFVEWPLTENLASTIELTKDLPHPSNSIIGLQGRVDPITLRLKELLKERLIGKVLSSEVRAFGNILERDGLPESLTYFTDRKVGGHTLNIHYGHTIDLVHEVLGDWQTSDAQMQVQRPELKIIDSDGSSTRTIASDIPDIISIHGTLNGANEVAVPNATLVVNFRVGPSFPNTPGFVWTINGESGELRLTAPGPYLFSGFSYDGPVKIEFHDFKTNEVKDVGWDWPRWREDLPYKARNTAELYDRYAEWVEGGKNIIAEGRSWPRLEDGAKLMKEFDILYKQYDPSW